MNRNRWADIVLITITLALIVLATIMWAIEGGEPYP